METKKMFELILNGSLIINSLEFNNIIKTITNHSISNLNSLKKEFIEYCKENGVNVNINNEILDNVFDLSPVLYRLRGSEFYFNLFIENLDFLINYQKDNTNLIKNQKIIENMLSNIKKQKHYGNNN